MRSHQGSDRRERVPSDDEARAIAAIRRGILAAERTVNRWTQRDPEPGALRQELSRLIEQVDDLQAMIDGEAPPTTLDDVRELLAGMLRQAKLGEFDLARGMQTGPRAFGFSLNLGPSWHEAAAAADIVSTALREIQDNHGISVAVVTSKQGDAL
jgi:hypothetical protein